MLQNFDVWQIVSLVLGALTLVFGTYVALAKKKLSEVVELVRQAYETADALNDALADNKITDEEKTRIATEWAELKKDLKALLAKETAE